MLGRRGSNKGGDWDQILEERGCALPSEPPKQLQTQNARSCFKAVVCDSFQNHQAQCSVLASEVECFRFPTGPAYISTGASAPFRRDALPTL